jgi:hypothetical protein
LEEHQVLELLVEMLEHLEIFLEALEQQLVPVVQEVLAVQYLSEDLQEIILE